MVFILKLDPVIGFSSLPLCVAIMVTESLSLMDDLQDHFKDCLLAFRKYTLLVNISYQLTNEDISAARTTHW